MMLFSWGHASAQEDETLVSEIKTLPGVCSSVVDISTPGDPHDLIMARRIIINQMTQQATLGRYATRAYNLSNPSDIFKPEYLLENLYYGMKFDQTTGVITLLATADKVVGSIRPGEGSHYWLIIGQESTAEHVICE
jgi:hypothetical protein